MLIFKYAKIQDAETVVGLVESAYRGEKSYKGWTTEADLLGGQRTDADEVSGLILSNNSRIILCEKNEQIVASLSISNKCKYAYLGMFAVSPEFQGTGIGKKLLKYAEDEIRKNWQSQFIEMTVITQRVELINWYKKQGYVLTGERREFPYGDERFGVPKRDDLMLDVLKKPLVSS